ncbi:hypothetical protein CEE39_06225 [bacterium (candidate division B38) B3_B38]|nr:MAG: hypothetical protein CEE39_06225 [bacterium (candidate division B38) B3_B38]
MKNQSHFHRDNIKMENSISYLSPEYIRQLLEIKSESKNLDYKEGLNWDDKASRDKKLEIIKDILAMANTQDGGKIVFGVKDDDFSFAGLKKNDHKSFDQTKVNELLHSYTDPKHFCHVCKQIIDGKYIVVIDVPEFQEDPIICKKDAPSSKNRDKLILKKGQIYIRTEKASSEIIPSVQEMRELLGRSLIKKGDELLSTIERLIKGKPSKASDESQEKYDEEIKEANNFIFQNIGNKLEIIGYWEVYAYPIEYNSKRISDQRKIRELIEKSEVALRGWNFPHTDSHGNASNFTKGRQSYTISEGLSYEGYCAYQSGLFIWKAAFEEDVSGIHTSIGKPALYVRWAIWSITEYFLFFKRYYVEIAPESDLHIKIVLNRTGDRQLLFLHPSSPPTDDLYERELHYNQYIAREPSIAIEKDIKVVDLRASYKEIANSIIKHIFSVFNWDDIKEPFIDQWQTRLIKRKF